ncbi:Cellulase (glycosyl hydrolase family 5) [Cnuella takakiae]|uniref:Cellulase (Glycosyl hydrolase family 5) n=1 Tax=Cnuella takakiae TaxID=1302690 RepID=A0A1M5H7G7_9BACT|nr:cellulase family glycosylhydrolase [Cnuella takakiae]OLY91090.1 hypothetical protein BUE76_03620 [Cnuella takakiae]SHG11662.1 Cellulase (glycosyl hydrolase family 5) [Cnuella takakiae]
MKGLLCWAALLFAAVGFAQKNTNPVYVDPSGVLRWTGTKKEAAFFGVNYTVPFAYGYRSHKALGVDPEKAIDADVAHMSRLGFDAFRVHVWDTEITDSAGNLLQNEHLRLFDYLLMRLKERGIKILITPLAFWGNGYPEPDQNTGSFSSKYNKRQVLVTPQAIAAQETYLKQFFRHVNSYTKTTYGNDPDVIAMEINNEPHHSGPKPAVTDYINRMAAAVRSTGWTKPVFYNISESPAYADAVAAAKVDGHSFQWYPTGLVANHTLQGNFLPNVDRYHIPFIDTIPAFRNRACMVYEFDAGDVIGSYMYPAMARSFRTAGFQWATQFAYDPLYTAHANTEYQTHYLNLAYTPGKAIGLMIAGKAFHLLPRGKSYGTYPADSVFGGFRVSYSQDLSEWNTDTAFFYTNNTASQPVQPAALKHIAGVGASPVVRYDGTGAYFLDKVGEGRWRIEILPDVLQVADPFGKAAPARTVRRLLANSRSLQLLLPGVGTQGRLFGADGSEVPAQGGAAWHVKPGVYYLGGEVGVVGAQKLEYPVLPLGADSVLLLHQSLQRAGAKGFKLHLEAAGTDSLWAELNHSTAGWRTVSARKSGGFGFEIAFPAELQVAGVLRYRIMARDGRGQVHVFPGDAKGDPFRWDAPASESWQTALLPAASQWVLFDAGAETQPSIFTTNWQKHKVGTEVREQYPYLWQSLASTAPEKGPYLGWQMETGDAFGSAYTHMLVNATGTPGTKLNLALVTRQGLAHTYTLSLGTDAHYKIPLAAFKAGSRLLLPRPYPGFQPLRFTAQPGLELNTTQFDFLQVWLEGSTSANPGALLLQTIILE